jgi:hypothetical protein
MKRNDINKININERKTFFKSMKAKDCFPSPHSNKERQTGGSKKKGSERGNTSTELK